MHELVLKAKAFSLKAHNVQNSAASKKSRTDT